MSDWEEIKRLAADFQKIQLSTTTQRLSERNCIEIINMLIEKKLVDLIFTSDGKEYLTSTQLITEIRNELYMHDGRVNLVELSQILGVDLHHINNHIADLLKSSAGKEITCILGQLIDSAYITRIAGEINEKLTQNGQINVSDLTIQYDLPADFILQQVIEKNLGKIIIGRQDKVNPKQFFTDAFIARSKAKIRGGLLALTQPTPISVLVSNIDVSETLFQTLFDASAMFGTLSGRQFIPNVYARSQNEWVSNFYKQNSYIEYDALVRLGIVDYKQYVRKQPYLNDLILLETCAIAPSLIERLVADIDESITSRTFLDLQNALPSVFTSEDIRLVLERALTTHKHRECILIDSTCLLSGPFIDGLMSDCETLVNERANLSVSNGSYQQHLIDSQSSSSKREDIHVEEVKVDKRDERRKKATGGKSGGGTQGRETKTKSSAKKRANVKSVEVERKQSTLTLIQNDDVAKSLQIVLESEGLDDLSDPIIEHLLPILNAKCMTLAAQLYSATVQDRTAARRQTHNDIQQRLNTLLTDVRLYEKGIRLLPAEVQPNFYKYLLKTCCGDFVGSLFDYIADEEGYNQTKITEQQRAKFVTELKGNYDKTALSNLVKSLHSANLEAFMDAVDPALATCSMIIKKVDKRKDRALILGHKQTLLEQLEKCEDAPLILHLAVLVIFISATQCLIHASGRHVKDLLSYLRPSLSADQTIELTGYHDMVTMVLSGGSDVETAKERLNDKMAAIKQIAIDFRKIDKPAT